MVGYGATLYIEGKGFKPNLLLEYIPEDLRVEKVTEKGETINLSRSRTSLALESSILILNKINLTTNTEDIPKQNEAFIKFLEKQYSFIKKIGGEDISLWLYIYFSDEYVNTELFDKEQLKKLAIYDVSLPLTIIKMSKKKIKKLLILSTN